MDGFNIGQSFENGVNRLFEFLPQLLGALVILVIGYFVAVGLKTITRKLLHKARFDHALHASPAGKFIARAVESPSQFVGKVVFWLVFLGVISLAASALSLQALNDFIGAIYGYLPHVLAAVIIFLVASAISVAAVAFVNRVMGKTPLAKIISAVVPTLTMSIAVFMILDELMIAEDIVMITYTALLGAVALGLALAFGIGGRDVASRLLEQAYEAGVKNADEVKAEAKRASKNTKREADKTRNRA